MLRRLQTSLHLGSCSWFSFLICPLLNALWERRNEISVAQNWCRHEDLNLEWSQRDFGFTDRRDQAVFALPAQLAEEVGFEPTEPFGAAVFRTAGINHSPTLPNLWRLESDSNGWNQSRFTTLAVSRFCPLTHLAVLGASHEVRTRMPCGGGF